jgi:DNA-binding NtrC family response regulator
MARIWRIIRMPHASLDTLVSAFALRPRLLIVEPDPELGAALRQAAGFVEADVCLSFQAARSCVESNAYSLLVTNVRLKAYNGVHLAYLAKRAQTATHIVVYDERTDLGLAREIQNAGAFYDLAQRLTVTLPAYIGAPLPDADRRQPASYDRRSSRRGGRRRWDSHSLVPQPAPEPLSRR